MRQYLRGGAGRQEGPGDEDPQEDVRTKVWYQISVKFIFIMFSAMCFTIYKLVLMFLKYNLDDSKQQCMVSLYTTA